MVTLDIYCGMLGVGKTTLIKRMLETEYQGVRAAIIENEIGKVNLDAKELTDIAVSELTSGCICCTFKGSFTEAVRTLIETEAPDVIIIEPSGVADIAAVADACLDVEGVELNRCVMVIKADRFRSFLKVAGPFLPEQIRAADTIYMNFTEKMKPEDIEAVKESILAIHPGVRIIAAPVDALDGSEFAKTMISKEKLAKSGAAIAVEEAGKTSAFPKMTFGKKQLYTWSYAFDVPFTEEMLLEFREILGNSGLCSLWRVKGYLPMADGTIRKIDYTLEDYFEESREGAAETDPSPDPEDQTGTVVFIGPRIDTQGLTKAFLRLRLAAE